MNNGGRATFIKVRGLTKSFGPKHVLRGVDLDVFEGETLVVLGGSGEGKSVLLKHLNGLERPDAGEIIVAGHNLDQLNEDELAIVMFG